jgi:hypothetical protein
MMPGLIVDSLAIQGLVSHRVPLAAAADDPGCHGLGGREPRVRRAARQVPRGRAHDLERRPGPPHGVHRVWPDISAADLLTDGPSHKG